jgi:hypothetical protein
MRKNLLNIGKTTRYFKYALVEIVLVVIGILFALQISNRNENRINNNKLKTYSTEIVKDFRNDTLSILTEINKAKRLVEARKSLLVLKGHHSLTADRLEKTLETLYAAVGFSNSTFENTEQSGIVNFGPYESLIEDYKTITTS